MDINYRVFSFGMIFGTVLAAYSMFSGATGFKSIPDLVAFGIFFGVVVESLAWTLLQSFQHQPDPKKRESDR